MRRPASRRSHASSTIGLLLAIGLTACVGDRGGTEAAANTSPAPAVAPASAAGPGSCVATADKLVELSVIEGKQSGREWSAEKQAKKRAEFIERCDRELPEGKVTRETLLCVEAATTLRVAQQCLLAATR